MCGFVGVFEIRRNGENLRAQVLRMSGKIRHRGPDWSGIYCGPRAVLSHERLSIVDPQSGGQPLYSPDGRLVLAVNGEIYNHRELRRELAGEYDFRTGSDCEVILPLYRKYGAGLLDRLNGIFAFALYDIERDEYLIARDPVGVIPLYIGWDADERCYVASELKALEGVCQRHPPPSSRGTIGGAARGRRRAGTRATGSTTKPSSRAIQPTLPTLRSCARRRPSDDS